MTKYTHINATNPLLIHGIKSDLTAHLPHLVPDLGKEVAATVPEKIGLCEDWTEIVLLPKMLEMVTLASGYVFIGPELSRRPEYMDATINFSVNAFGAADSLKQWPAILRRLAAGFLDSRVLRLREQRKSIIQFLAPHIEQRKALRTQGAEDAPKDMLQWFVNKAPKFNQDTIPDLAALQSGLGIVAIHTTANTATHILFDILASCPEIIPELRQEIYSVLEANGGCYSAKALNQMKLMDSVMKESQRLNPLILSSFRRRLLKPVTLSNGVVLPQGVWVASGLINTTRDEAYFEEPNSFNPYRFMDLRSGKAKDPLNYGNKEENQSFGYGRHSCPGRFLAATEIKLILAETLTNYDIRLPDGVKERYQNIRTGDLINPDPSKSILFKKIDKSLKRVGL
ncbi:cytochrome P450 [Colletotrichum caudatum]|nr:cytochrome P450 [Colletotrichum caudatum]